MAAEDSACLRPGITSQGPKSGFMSFPADPQPATPARTAGRRLVRLLPLALIALVSVTVIAFGWHEHLSLAGLVTSRAAIDAVVAVHPIAALAGFAAAYALAVALSLPGAVFLTILGGAIFGAWVGGLAALVGATAGATAIFLVAKSALGEWMIRRAGQRAAKLASGFCDDAFYYLLFLRLVPVFPFWLVNLAPALCGVRLMTFVAATALGIMPGTFAFAIFGAGLDHAAATQLAAYRACQAAGGTSCALNFDPAAAATPQLIAGLVALGLLALIPVVVRRRKARAQSELSSPR
jgi:uncharacterized membrane protein YdjX (TVP38/TMEM64 family)